MINDAALSVTAGGTIVSPGMPKNGDGVVMPWGQQRRCESQLKPPRRSHAHLGSRVYATPDEKVLQYVWNVTLNIGNT